MSLTLPPTGAEITTALQAAGVLSNPLTAQEAMLDFDLAALSAYLKFINETGLKPLITEGANSSRRYDPPGPESAHKYRMIGGDCLLGFEPPYQSITSITVYDDPGTAGDGLLLIEATDYDLQPWVRIENTRIDGCLFRYPIRSVRGAIVIVGKVGYFADFPADIWKAIRDGAMGDITLQLRDGIMANPTDWAEGPSREKYNVETLLKLGTDRAGNLDKVISDYFVIRI